MRKVLIIGPMRSGKDTLAEIWSRSFGLRFESSSMFAAKELIYDRLKVKYNYSTFEECFHDRVNHRIEWRDIIDEYTENDPSKLARAILSQSDCYVGMRDEVQFLASRSLFDVCVYVEAPERVKIVDPTLSIPSHYSDYILSNNGSKYSFIKKSIKLGKEIFCK